MNQRYTRKPRSWPEHENPMLLPISGYRDQIHRITYLPWSDVTLGAIGWEVFPDRSVSNVLVYIMPMADDTGLEIRCHATESFPDPSKDQLLGTIHIPLTLLHPEA
jgi:hypothetical protein